MPGCSQFRLFGLARQYQFHARLPVVLVENESLALGRQIARLAILDVVEELHLGRHREAGFFALLVQSSEDCAADFSLKFVETAI